MSSVLYWDFNKLKLKKKNVMFKIKRFQLLYNINTAQCSYDEFRYSNAKSNYLSKMLTVRDISLK